MINIAKKKKRCVLVAFFQTKQQAMPINIQYRVVHLSYCYFGTWNQEEWGCIDILLKVSY